MRYGNNLDLHRAAGAGDEAEARELLALGLPINHASEFSGTALHWGIRHPNIIRLLLENGADANNADNRERKTPLHSAAWTNAVPMSADEAAVLQMLIRHGADLTARDWDGRTPLHVALEHHRTDVAEFLRACIGEQDPFPPLPGAPWSDRVRAHPTRPEAVSTVRYGALARWSSDDLTQPLLRVQTEHPHITDIAISPDGETVALAIKRNFIEIRRYDDFAFLRRIELAHVRRLKEREKDTQLHTLAISDDGKWLAAAGTMEDVHIFEWETGRYAAFTYGGENTLCVRFSPSSRLLARACSFQGGTHVGISRLTPKGRWRSVRNLGRSDVNTPSSDFVDTIAFLAFSPDSRRLALFETLGTEGNWLGNVVMLSPNTPEPKWIQSVDAEVTGDTRTATEAGRGAWYLAELVFLGDNQIVCGATQGTLLFYDAASGNLTHRLKFGTEASVLSLSPNRENAQLWAALSDGNLVCNRLNTVEPFSYRPRLLPEAVEPFSRRPRLLPKSAEPFTHKSGVLPTDDSVQTIQCKRPVTAVAFSPNGKTFAAGFSDDAINCQIFDSQSYASLFRLGLPTSIAALAFSPDGAKLAIGGSEHSVFVYRKVEGEAFQREAQFTLDAHTMGIAAVAFSPDGRFLATASYDKTAKLWDAQTGIELLTFGDYRRPVLSVAFSQDSQYLAIGSWDGTVRVWDIESRLSATQSRGGSSLLGSLLRVLSPAEPAPVFLSQETGAVTGVAFSPEGISLAASYSEFGDAGKAKVWDTASGRERFTLTGHLGSVYAIAWSPDGTRIATAGKDFTVRLWDTENGQEVRTLRGHFGVVRCVAFSPDGKMLLAGSDHNALKIWNL